MQRCSVGTISTSRSFTIRGEWMLWRIGRALAESADIDSRCGQPNLIGRVPSRVGTKHPQAYRSGFTDALERGDSLSALCGARWLSLHNFLQMIHYFNGGLSERLISAVPRRKPA